MGFSRKKWNNIIIIACLVMVSVLTLIYDDKRITSTHSSAASTTLFDDSTPLVKLKIGVSEFEKKQNQWQCSPNVMNCHEWAESWARLHITPLGTFERIAPAQTVTIYIAGFSTPQNWSFSPQAGVLTSPKNNQYTIPVDIRNHLFPQLHE